LSNNPLTYGVCQESQKQSQTEIVNNAGTSWKESDSVKAGWRTSGFLCAGSFVIKSAWLSISTAGIKAENPTINQGLKRPSWFHRGLVGNVEIRERMFITLTKILKITCSRIWKGFALVATKICTWN